MQSKTNAPSLPFISVMVTLYNREDTIQRLLDSVLPFLSEEDEMVVVNDGSTDDGPKIVEKAFEGRANCRLVNQNNRGMVGAWNRCLDEIRGEFVLNIDSDDYLPGNGFTTIRKALKEMDPDILHFGFSMLFPDGRYAEYPNFPSPVHLKSKREMLSSNVFRSRLGAVLATFTRQAIRRSLIGDIRFSPPAQGSDNPFMNMIFTRANSFAAILDICYCINVTPNSVSRSPMGNSFYEQNMKRMFNCLDYFLSEGKQEYWPLAEAAAIYYTYRDYCYSSIKGRFYNKALAKEVRRGILKNKAAIMPKGRRITTLINYLYLHSPALAVFAITILGKGRAEKKKRRTLGDGEYAY